MEGYGLKIIHCADLHLDSKMETNLTKEQAKERRYELLATFERMVDMGIAEGVSVILIVGDMFDTVQSNQKRLKARVLDKIKSTNEIDFLYLQGNHDKDNYFKELYEKPENLYFFSDQWNSYTYDEVVISGMEFGSGNKQKLYNNLILNENNINIVMMHGQVVNSGQHQRAEDIVLNELQDKYIDYLALGHIHKYQMDKLDYRGVYCYSGCLEGRGYDECGEKGFVLLDIIDGKIISEFRPIAKRQMHEIHIDITGVSEHNEIINGIHEMVEDISSSDYVKVVLEGQIEEDVDIDINYLSTKITGQFYTSKIEDKSEIKIDYMKYEHDLSLKGEFIRCVQELELTEQEKSKAIRMGIHALNGKEVI